MSKRGLRTLLPACCVLLVVGWAAGLFADAPVTAQLPGVLPDAGPAVDSSEEVALPLPDFLNPELDPNVPPDETVADGPDQPPGAIVGQIRSGSTWQDSEPLPGAMVWLFKKAPDHIHFEAGTQTGPEGNYAFAPVHPGMYLLVPSAPEHLPKAAIVCVHPGQEKVRHFLLHPVGPPEFGAIAGHEE